MSEPGIEPYVHMLERLREPLLIASGSWRILASNVAAAEALGTSVSALVGTNLSSFAVAAIDLGEPATGRPFPVRASDGRRFLCDGTPLGPDLILLRLSGSPDVGPRARMFFDALLRLHGLTGEIEDTHALRQSRAWLDRWIGETGALAGGVFLLDPIGETLELIHEANYPKDAADQFRLVPLAAQLPHSAAVRRRAPVLLGTAEDYATQFPELAQAFPSIARMSMACIPLEAFGRCVGVVVLGFALPRTFTEQDRALFRALALECARDLEHARRLDLESTPAMTERAASQFARMQAFTGALAKSLTPAEVTEAIVDMGMTASSARSGGLWLTSPDGKVACLARSVGPTGPRPETHANVPIDQPIRMPILDAIRSGHPIWIESCEQLEERYPEIFRAFSGGGQSSLACLPLFAHGRCIGGLALNYDGKHQFLEDERAFLQVLAWYSAQAIERARLYAAETRARRAAEASQRRSDFLADSSALLTSSLDHAATLESVARAALPRVADWCIVELAEGGRPVAAHVDPSKLPSILEVTRRIRLGGDDHGILGVIRSGKAQLDRVIAPTSVPDELGLVSSMTVPIAARGRTLGAILLASADPAHLYDELDLAMAEELGRIAGLAVDNARMYRDAREADRRKDEFLAMLGHELRNPLAPIVSTLQVMELAGGDVFVRERALISRQVQHLVRLVGDLLDVARVTRDKIHLRMERCELARVVETAVEMASPLVAERRHHLTVDARPGVIVVADRDRLAQVISNVLNNAAKYTEPGGTISVTALGVNGEAVIRVRDSGIGIDRQALPRIFDLFVQEATAIDRSQGGLGVGLTVVRRLVELQGGSVSADSAGLGHGSEFVMRFPLAAGELVVANLEEPAARPSAEPSGRGLVVLVVDDNFDAAEWLCEALEHLGCSTRVAHDGEAALRAAAELEPDLALLDLGLPAMTGYELARRLRQLSTTANTRLVAVTGYGEPSDYARSHEAGFHEHLIKPVALEELRGTLERVRRGHSGLRLP